MKLASLLFAVAGLLVTTLLIGWYGAGEVAQSLLAAGWSGLAAVCGWQLLMFVPLAAAWAALLSGRGVGYPIVYWGRMVRDTSANCLPFSQFGGFVFGARAVMMRGLRWHVAAASTVVDITAEFLSQIVFAAVALGVLLQFRPDWPLARAVALGLAGALMAGLVFLWMQRRDGGALLVGLARRMTRSLLPDESGQAELVRQELALLAGHPGRFMGAFLWHLVGWLSTAVAGWIAFRLLGARVGLAEAVAIEGLLHGAFALSAFIPANLGVQEAAYVALAGAFGVPAEAALGVSLLRRGRDLVVGVPVLLAWQAAELRRATRR